jgi:PAS domain S-box-containing protein
VGSALATLPASLLIYRAESARHVAEKRAETQLVLSEVRLTLDAALAGRLVILRALAAFAASQPDGDQAAFAAYAATLSAHLPDVRSLQLARDLTVSHVYPTINNNGILGLHLPDRLPPAQLIALKRAIDNDRPTLDGPIPLLQGGTGIILRLPVHSPVQDNTSAPLWGLATVILDAREFFQLAASPATGIRLSVRAKGADNATSRMLAGDPAVFHDDPARVFLETPGDTWELAAVPASGWTPLPIPPSLTAGGFAAWLVLAAALFFLLSWPARLAAAVARATAALDASREDLERTVAERTAALTTANDALRASEARYQAFIDATSGMAFFKDENLRYLVVNRNLCQFYGLPPEAVIGHDDSAVMPPELVAECRRSDLAAMEGNTVLTAMESLGDRHFEVRKFPVPLPGGKTGVGGYVYDVTDRMNAENALRRSEETLRSLYDNAPIGIFTSTPAGNYLKVNPFLAHMYDHPNPEEMLRHIKAIDRQTYVDPDDRRRMLEQVAASGALTGYELRRRTRSGRIIWVSLYVRAVRDAAGVTIRLEGFCTDITTRKKAEEALADQERTLRVIFDNSPLGLVAFAPDGTMLKCNLRFQEIVGATAAELTGAKVLADMPEFARTALVTALAGQPARAEGPYKSVIGGCSRILRAMFNPVLAGTSPTPVIASVEDITVSHQQEQSLRLLRAAVEQSPASIVVTDAAGAIEYVNPYFTDLTGYSAEEALGKTPRVLSSGVHDRAFFEAMWDTLMAGGIWRGELCNRKRNGELYWEDSSISPIRNDQGEITHFVAVKEDITAQKEREARVHRLMSEFEAIFNASSVGIVHLGGDGRVVRANARFGALFGIDAADLVGRSLDTVHESEKRQESLRREILTAVAGGQEAYVEERFRSRTGRALWCAVHGRGIDPAAPQSGSIWIFDDITARKELEAIREDVERIMRHDLKAPLNSIVNLPELVPALGPVNEEQRDVLEEIERAGRLMLEQIDLSLDLYKMETGSYTPALQRIDLARILASTLEMLAPLARSRGVALDFPDAPAPAFATGSALLVQTIAGNLLKNALEAETNGAVVTVRLTAANGQAGFTVANPSPVPAEIIPIFFEKYVTSGKPGGNGLGTYSARLMTECQGGTIRLDVSEAGTTVSVTLPAA